MADFAREIRDFFFANNKFLSENYPGVNEHRLQTEFSDFFSPTENDLNRFLNGLKRGTPLAYLSGKAFFYNSVFKVNSHTLIPRYETEILVEMSLAFINKNSVKEIVDIGIGPGTILLSILKEASKELVAYGIDISSEALEVCSENLDSLQKEFKLKHKVKLLKNDRLKELNLKFDLIVSNPPYIKFSDRNSVHAQVDKFEPHLALYISDADYTNWFCELFREVSVALNPNGLFLMEGHENHLAQLLITAQKYFSDVKIIKDLTGKDRFLSCRFK